MQFSFSSLGAQAQGAAQRARAANPFARAPRSVAGRVLYAAAAVLLAVPVAILILALLLCGFACVILLLALFIAFAVVRAGLRLIASRPSSRQDLSQPDDFGRENVRVRDRSSDTQ